MGCVHPGCPIRTPFEHCERHAAQVIAQLRAEIKRLRAVAVEPAKVSDLVIGVKLAKKLAGLAAQLNAVAATRAVGPSPVKKQRWVRKPQMVSLTIRPVLAAVSSHLGVTVAYLCGDSHLPRAVKHRQIAMAAVRKITAASLPEIGRAFRRDHGTVLYSIRRADEAQVEALVLAISKIPCPLDVPRIAPSMGVGRHEESASSSGHRHVTAIDCASFERGATRIAIL